MTLSSILPFFPAVLAALGAATDNVPAETTGWAGNAMILWWFHTRMTRLENSINKRGRG